MTPGGDQQMQRLTIWSLVAGLAVGNLVGCSRTSTKPPNASSRTRSDRAVAEGRQQTGLATARGKASAGIKWDKSSGRLLKPQRKTAKGAQITPTVDKISGNLLSATSGEGQGSPYGTSCIDRETAGMLQWEHETAMLPPVLRTARGETVTFDDLLGVPELSQLQGTGPSSKASL